MSFVTMAAALLLTLLVGSGESAWPAPGEKGLDAPVAPQAAAAVGTGKVPAPEKPVEEERSRGLVVKKAGVADGYVLFSPILSWTTYLIDNDGRVVHTWRSDVSDGQHQYLLSNGNLLRLGRDRELESFRTGGVCGLLEELDWDGNAVWTWRFGSDSAVNHHDVEPLPNGNLLVLAWESKSPEEARAAGRRPDLIPEKGLWPDWLLEIEPIRPEGARVVWEWHVWDHLVQNHDASLPNYGDPAAHPHRLDINAAASDALLDPDQIARLQALGYMPADARPQDLKSDFLHANSVDYHAGLDQIVLSVPSLGEIWIIDHSTTTAEAAGSTGGRAGHGGDILYRWGNPGAYGRGPSESKRFFFQHDARWVPGGFPGAGRLTVFNNGNQRPAGPWSSVEEIIPPLVDGRYALEPGKAFGPPEPAWTYVAPQRETFFAPFISGAHRIENGNTLVCQGPDGRLFEVSSAGELVWDYRNPYSEGVRPEDGWVPPGIEEKPWAVFRADRILPSHPALAGRSLEPLDPQPPTGIHR